MSALRSIVFTLLLEEPEFGALSADDGSRMVTDACERVTQDQMRHPNLTTATIMANYANDVTANHTCEPGVFGRYVAALRADDARVQPCGFPEVTGLPEGMTAVERLTGR